MPSYMHRPSVLEENKTSPMGKTLHFEDRIISIVDGKVVLHLLLIFVFKTCELIERKNVQCLVNLILH